MEEIVKLFGEVLIEFFIYKLARLFYGTATHSTSALRKNIFRTVVALLFIFFLAGTLYLIFPDLGFINILFPVSTGLFVTISVVAFFFFMAFIYGERNARLTYIAVSAVAVLGITAITLSILS